MPQLRASDLSRDYGFTPRYWIRLAAAGRVPGARQPSGPGGQWVFDEREVRKWAASVGLAAPEPHGPPAPRPGFDQPMKPKRKARPTDEVYLLYSAGHVKIGVSCNSKKRAHGFRTASPVPIVELCRLPGSTTLETTLHRRFNDCRTTGEWFKLSRSAALRTFVETSIVECRGITLDSAERQFRGWLEDL